VIQTVAHLIILGATDSETYEYMISFDKKT